LTTSLTLVRRIEAPPKAVFDAFVEPDKIALWWGPDDGPVLSAEVDPRVGGRFHVRFRLAKDGSEHGCGGTFEVFERPTRLAMSWTWDGEEGPDSHIDVRLRAVDGGTEVTFTHSRLGDEETRRSHEQGWNGAFDKLQAKAGTLA
jgi:uncharacterized protein YndB with AHSA1/START domain